jgi:hypothetical protein
MAVVLAEILSIVSALSMLVPAILLSLMLRSMKIPPLRTATILLISFAAIHGVYHLVLFGGVPGQILGNILDLISVLLLIALGIYYGRRLA